jgi:hemerythrin HHE cation binding domain-containing protein
MTRREEDVLRQERLIQPADAMGMLHADHRRIHKLFQWYATTNDPARQSRSVLALVVALEVSIQLEDHVFYPALAEATPHAVHVLLETGLDAHTQIEVAIEERRGCADDAAFTATFHALRRLVDQHLAYAAQQLLLYAAVALADQGYTQDLCRNYR